MSEPNDIDATGECCCNGCIGEGLCDLDPHDEDDWNWYDDMRDAEEDRALYTVSIADLP